MNPSTSSQPPVGIDKNALYGEWVKGEKRRQDINARALEKSFDLPPEDDVQITNEYSGMTLKHLLGIAVVITAILAGFGGMLGVFVAMGGMNRAATQQNPPVQIEAEPLKFKVGFEWPEQEAVGTVERLDPGPDGD